MSSPVADLIADLTNPDQDDHPATGEETTAADDPAADLRHCGPIINPVVQRPGAATETGTTD